MSPIDKQLLEAHKACEASLCRVRHIERDLKATSVSTTIESVSGYLQRTQEGLKSYICLVKRILFVMNSYTFSEITYLMYLITFIGSIEFNTYRIYV